MENGRGKKSSKVVKSIARLNHTSSNRRIGRRTRVYGSVLENEMVKQNNR